MRKANPKVDGSNPVDGKFIENFLENFIGFLRKSWDQKKLDRDVISGRLEIKKSISTKHNLMYSTEFLKNYSKVFFLCVKINVTKQVSYYASFIFFVFYFLRDAYPQQGRVRPSALVSLSARVYRV